MDYRIHFVGLACFIKDTDYLIALPDGTSGTVKAPCDSSSAPIDRHVPYLIIEKKNVISSQLPGRIVNECFVVDLSAAKNLTFATASEAGDTHPDDNDTFTQRNGLRWDEIDEDFKPDTANLSAVVTVQLRQGTIVARRLRGDDREGYAIIHEVMVTRAAPGAFDVYAGSDLIRVAQGAEIVVANVAPDWITSVKYVDDEKHFLLYYSLDAGNGKCKIPDMLKSPSETTSQHPYLRDDRGLRVACSNTTYP